MKYLSATCNKDLDTALHIIFEDMTFEAKFVEWLCDNWLVYEMFEKIADDLWSRGITHYSAKGILEIVRYKMTISNKINMYEINQSLHASLARLFLMRYPSRANFFTIREKNPRHDDVIWKFQAQAKIA